jgi:hypothetical protein
VQSLKKSFILFCCLLAAACGGNGGDGPRWTVFVYMAADNDLEPFAIADLKEMAAVSGSSQLRFVAQLDRSAGYSDEALSGAGDFHGAKRLLVESGGFKPVGDLGAVNMAAPSTLADFLKWGIQNYPADKYALVVWDHGGAWTGIGIDDSSGGDILTLLELRKGLQDGLAGQKLQLIGFDACLMGTLEVAQAAAPYADYLLASEALEPGTGWPYQAFQLIRNDASKGPEELGKAIADAFLSKSNEDASRRTNVSLSVVRLGQLSPLLQGVNDLALAAKAALAEGSSGLAFARTRTIKFGEVGQGPSAVPMLDLGHLAEQLSHAGTASPVKQALASARAQVSSALGSAVAYRAGNGVAQSASGLSLHFPARRVEGAGSSSTAAYGQLVQQLQAGGLSRWLEFLTAYFDAPTATGFAHTAHLGTVSVGGEGFTLTGALAQAAQPPGATFFYGTEDSPDTYLLLGQRPAVAQEGALVGTWPLTRVKLSQGGVESEAFMAEEFTPDGSLSAFIPFSYIEEGKEPRLAFRHVIRDAGGNLAQDVYYVQNDSAFGELSPTPGSQLYPIRHRVAVGGTGAQMTLTAEVGFSATGAIALEFVTVPSGATAFGALRMEGPLSDEQFWPADDNTWVYGTSPL